ncbi:MAG: hypothetical protein NTZ56_16535 [Acidobacteria bacterium]|nr:hypothetical protein [Acidobacteriota bacterium]
MPATGQRIIAIITVLCLAASASPARAHTFHSSIAQLDYITAKKKFELIIWIHADDLERLLKDQHGPSVTFDKPKEAERLVHDYLRANFELRTPQGKLLPHHWVGLEVRTHFIAAYIEIPWSEGIADLQLTNRILLAELPDQVNVVKVKQDSADRRNLEFNRRGAPATQPLLTLTHR